MSGLSHNGVMSMLQAIEGIYRNGKVELTAPGPQVDQARVLVTFLPSDGDIDLEQAGIDEAAAASLRHRFGMVADDWDQPEMDVYDE